MLIKACTKNICFYMFKRACAQTKMYTNISFIPVTWLTVQISEESFLSVLWMKQLLMDEWCNPCQELLVSLASLWFQPGGIYYKVQNKWAGTGCCLLAQASLHKSLSYFSLRWVFFHPDQPWTYCNNAEIAICMALGECDIIQYVSIKDRVRHKFNPTL